MFLRPGEWVLSFIFELLRLLRRHSLTCLQPQNVLRVTNGFISDWIPSGYRDVKVNPIVNGHLCEIQLHLRDLFSLKQGQHTVYEWARDLRVTAAMQSGYLFENLSSELTQEMIRLAGRNWHGTQDLLSMLLLNNGQFAQAQGALHEVRHVLWLVVESMLFMHAGFPARDNPRLVRSPIQADNRGRVCTSDRRCEKKSRNVRSTNLYFLCRLIIICLRSFHKCRKPADQCKYAGLSGRPKTRKRLDSVCVRVCVE